MREVIDRHARDAELERTLLGRIRLATRLQEATEIGGEPWPTATGHPERIRLSVRDGKVTLTGTVRSWAEGQVVVGVVRRAPGVVAVDSRLRINPNV